MSDKPTKQQKELLKKMTANVSKHPDWGVQCAHGSLKRQCLLCEYEARIKELETAIKKHRDELRKDRAYGDAHDVELYKVLED